MCLLLLLVGTARAQITDVRQLRELSARWAEYYAAIYRVPTELVEAIIDEESGWNPYAVSNKGATGIMQLMPGNGSALRGTQLLSRGREHPWRRGIPGVAEGEIQR